MYLSRKIISESLNDLFICIAKSKKEICYENTKFVESADTLAFTPQEGSNGKFDMKGTGANKFGAFSMNGR